MTQITARADVPHPGTGPAAPVHRSQEKAWLQEFERARFEAQPRYRAGGPADTPSAQAFGPGAHSPTASSAGDARAVEPDPHLVSDPHSPQEGMTAESLVRLGHDRLSKGAFVQNFAAALPHAVSRLPVTGSPETTPLPPSAAVSWREPWAKRHLHVQDTADTLSVWVRDARLDDQSTQALVERLARWLTDDAGRPKSLRLTVNGHTLRPLNVGTLSVFTTGDRHGG